MPKLNYVIALYSIDVLALHLFVFGFLLLLKLRAFLPKRIRVLKSLSCLRNNIIKFCNILQVSLWGHNE